MNEHTEIFDSTVDESALLRREKLEKFRADLERNIAMLLISFTRETGLDVLRINFDKVRTFGFDARGNMNQISVSVGLE